MAVTGSEPISAANLRAALEAMRGVVGPVSLFSGECTGTAALERDSSGFDVLLVTVKAYYQTNANKQPVVMSMTPGETITVYAGLSGYPNIRITISGGTLTVRGDTSYAHVSRVIGMRLS